MPNKRQHHHAPELTFAANPERKTHQKFYAKLLKALHPEGALETQYAQALVEDHSRLNRLRGIQSRLLPKGNSAEILLAHAQELSFLTRYKKRLARAIQRKCAELDALQTQRGVQFIGAQLSPSTGPAVDPAEIGFVFANAETNPPAKIGFVFANAQPDKPLTPTT